MWNEFVFILPIDLCAQECEYFHDGDDDVVFFDFIACPYFSPSRRQYSLIALYSIFMYFTVLIGRDFCFHVSFAIFALHSSFSLILISQPYATRTNTTKKRNEEKKNN